jgi:ribosomal protein L11 methyltransferase
VIRLAIRVSRDQAELVLAELAELAPAGLEERDVDADTVEYAIYGAPGELPPLPDLKAAAGGALVDVSTTELADDWDVRWRTWHPAVVVEAGGRTLRVRPPWEEPQPGTIDVAIEPAQAFGTGAHETTRLSLALLMELAATNVPGTDVALADWGCGSGVLAIAAAKLGWGPVGGYDHEALAIEAAAANAAANGVEVHLERMNLRETLPKLAPTMVANMTAPVLAAVAKLMSSTPAVLICSCLLPSSLDAIAPFLAGVCLAEAERRREGDWAALLLRRP